MRWSVLVAIVLMCVAVVAGSGYAYGQARQQPSLRHGIAQTQQSIAQVNKLLDENQADISTLMFNVKIQLAGYTPLGKAIDAFNLASNVIVGEKAFKNGRYWEALGQVAEAVATLWGRGSLDLGTKGIDAVADVLELQSLMREQQQLTLAQTALQLQLFRLQGKDPETLAQWQQMLNNLYGDPAVEHAAFLKFLAANGLSEKDVAAKALANAAAVSPGTASRVASGMSIVDPTQVPDNLAGMPGINPDFIAALKCDRDGIQSLLNGGNGMGGVACPRCRVGDPCDRYADGSYINAFGPPSYDPSRAGASSGQVSGVFRSRQAAPKLSGSGGATYQAKGNATSTTSGDHAGATSRLSDDALRASLLAAGEEAVPQIVAWMQSIDNCRNVEYKFKDVIVPTDDGNNRNFYQYGMPSKEHPIVGYIDYTYYWICPGNGPNDPQAHHLNGPIPWRFLYDGTHWEIDWEGRKR
jgi:hypothetical protein